MASQQGPLREGVSGMESQSPAGWGLQAHEKAEVINRYWLMVPSSLRIGGAMKTWACWEHAHPATT